jgi:hypothetical protein
MDTVEDYALHLIFRYSTGFLNDTHVFEKSVLWIGLTNISRHLYPHYGTCHMETQTLIYNHGY